MSVDKRKFNRRKALHLLFNNLKYKPCFHCGILLSKTHATIDHLIPLSQGGSLNELENLQISCGICNWSKENYSTVDWDKLKKFSWYKKIVKSLNQISRIRHTRGPSDSESELTLSDYPITPSKSIMVPWNEKD